MIAYNKTEKLVKCRKVRKDYTDLTKTFLKNIGRKKNHQLAGLLFAFITSWLWRRSPSQWGYREKSIATNIKIKHFTVVWFFSNIDYCPRIQRRRNRILLLRQGWIFVDDCWLPLHHEERVKETIQIKKRQIPLGLINVEDIRKCIQVNIWSIWPRKINMGCTRIFYGAGGNGFLPVEDGWIRR